MAASLCALLAGSAHADASARAARLEERHVLILASYAYGRPGLDAFLRSHVDALVQGGLPRENIWVEYLNLNRDDSAAYRARLRALLLPQYSAQRIDMIVTLQQPALDFALGNMADLAPEAPVMALDAATPAPAALGHHAVLLTRQADNVRATLRQALRLFPATEHLMVAVGAAPADQKIKRMITAEVLDMGLRLNVDYLDTLTLSGMLAHAATALPHTIILLGSINRDSAGKSSTTLDMSLKIAGAARAPTFALFSTGIGLGLTGGEVMYVERTAASIAATGLDILAGRATAPTGVARIDYTVTSMYDWALLKRWGADPELLPAATVFVNRPVSMWQAHRAMVIAGAVAITLLSILSGALLIQRRKLLIAEGRFRVLVDHAPEAIVVYDAAKSRFVNANRRAEQLFGTSRADLLTGGPDRFYVDVQPDGQPVEQSIFNHAQRGLAGEELVFERMVKSRDGRVFPCEVRVVALPSRSGKLLRAGYVDISERRRAEREQALREEGLEDQVASRTAALSQALRDAQAASRAKSVFLANMSHELRTPLNSIIGFSQLMAESTSLFDDEKRSLTLINRAGHLLLSLINDILELSKIEAGQLHLAFAPVDLNALLRDAHDLVCLAARQKGLALCIDCPDPLPAVVLDGGKLRQVLLNLLSNAVKFTDAGTVTLSVVAADAGGAGAGSLALTFSVRDTGTGIAPDDCERIFEPFMQADSGRIQAGTGLGLTISRQFVRLLGGALTVTSHPGTGSVFSFTITTQTTQAAQAASVPSPPLSQAVKTENIEAAELARLSASERQALHAALQQLDMRQVAHLLDALAPEHASVVAAVRSLLAQHRYPELCALLEATLTASAS